MVGEGECKVLTPDGGGGEGECKVLTPDGGGGEGSVRSTPDGGGGEEECKVLTSHQLPAWLQKIVNPLSPNSDKHLISPHNITTWSNRQVMRMKEMITKDEMT